MINWPVRLVEHLYSARPKTESSAWSYCFVATPSLTQWCTRLFLGHGHGSMIKPATRMDNRQPSMNDPEG